MNLNSRKPGLYPSFFVPQPSDNLQILIYKQYGVTPSDANTYGLLSEYLLQLNPEVKSVQQVFGKHVPRTLNFISHSAADLVCQNPDLIKRQISSYMQPGRQFSQSAAFAQYAPDEGPGRSLYEMLVRASMDLEPEMLAVEGGLGLMGSLSKKAHKETLFALNQLRAQRSAKKMSAQQYQFQQKQILNTFKKKLGVLEHLVYGGKGAHGALYLNKTRGIEPPAGFVRDAQRWGKVAGLVKAGSVVLTAHAISQGCSDIASAKIQSRKNEVAYETLFSIGTGLAVSAFVVLGPMGLAVGLVAHAALSFGGGFVGKAAGSFAYDKVGNQIDLADTYIVRRFCS